MPKELTFINKHKIQTDLLSGRKDGTRLREKAKNCAKIHKIKTNEARKLKFHMELKNYHSKLVSGQGLSLLISGGPMSQSV